MAQGPGAVAPAGRLALTDAITRELAELSGLPDLDEWRDLGGSRSTNILSRRPDDPDGLVFRVQQEFVGEDRLRAEQDARRVLAARGLPTVTALPIFAGSTIARLRSGNLVEAERYVESDADMDDPARLVRGFATLGSLHDALRDAPLPTAARTVAYANHLDSEIVLERTRTGCDRIRSWQIPELADFADRLTALLAVVHDHESALHADQHRQIVHGDFWDNNVLFAHGEVAAILDFGFMAERPRIDDLALPIWFYLLGEPAGDPAPIEVAAAMVDAYDAVTDHPLTPAERLALPLVIARQPAWMVGRWVNVEADRAAAERIARDAAAELPVAIEVLGELRDWQQALT